MIKSKRMLTIQKIRRLIRKYRGIVQTLSRSQVMRFKYNCQNVNPKKTSVIIIIIGLNGASAVTVLNHAPPIPSSSNRSGPIQHNEAAIPDSVATTKELLTPHLSFIMHLVSLDCFLTHLTRDNF